MNDQTPAPHDGQIGPRAARAVLWNYLSFGLGKASVFLTTAILARLLTPADFGVVALATVAITYLSIIKDFGLGAALIQQRQNVEEAANTVFTLGLLFNGTLTILGWVLAPWVADYFREPLVTPVLRVLSLSFVLNALGQVHVVLLQRELAFRRKLIPDLGHSLIKGVVSVACALAGLGVWSLVIGHLAGAASAALLVRLVLPWRPRLTIDLRLARRLATFGLALVGVDALSVLIDNFDYLIVGRVFGNEVLGVYFLAYRVPELLVLQALWAIAGAMFPAYSSVQDRPDSLRAGYLLTIRYVEMFSVPLSLGLVFTADPLVRVAFGDQWLAAIPIVQVLAIFALVRSIGFNAGDVYKAVGRTGVLFRLDILNVVVLVAALLIGVRFGLLGVAFGHLMAAAVRTLVDLWVAARILHVSRSQVLHQLRPSFLAGCALVALAWAATVLTNDLAPFHRLVAISLAGAAGYLTVLWALEREALIRAAVMVGRWGPPPATVDGG